MIETNIATTQEQEQKNREKYGEKDDDVIARAYREGKIIGDVWCSKNAEKYMRRFISKSSKSNNLMDLYKVRDYVNRMIEFNEQHPSAQRDEVIDVKQ